MAESAALARWPLAGDAVARKLYCLMAPLTRASLAETGAALGERRQGTRVSLVAAATRRY